jgi:hypothetical protein
LASFVAPLIDRIKSSDNAEWVEYGPEWFMENIHSTDIHPLGTVYEGGGKGYTVKDSDLIQLIDTFHSKGLKVLLRPTLEFHYFRPWRGVLEPTDWNLWFQSYANFITHYARIAEQTGVELYCVGNELKNAEVYPDKWKDIISKVRQIYHGPLTYSDAGFIYGNNSNVRFWSDLDIISIGYYPPITGAGPYWDTGVEPMLDPPLELYIQQMEEILDGVFPVHQQYGKPVLVDEAGCVNYDGANQIPYDLDYWGKLIDNQEQADFFEAALQVTSKRDWIKGYFAFVFNVLDGYNYQVWNVPITFDFRDKPAEGVIKFWYK